MEPKTLEALKASIKKWERNVRVRSPEEAQVGVGSCALCALFYDDGCDGCPVYDRTGRVTCDETPYSHAWKSWDVWFDTKLGACSGEELKNSKKAWQTAAQAEVDFLKSLLPEGEK